MIKRVFNIKMKSLNFKRKEDSYLRYFDEQKKQNKRPINWDRIVYITLLFLALFFVGRYIIKSYFYIEGNGQVLFENVDIRHTDDIRIHEFFINEGDDVLVGDTLFTYFLDDDMFGGGGGGGNSVSIGGGGSSGNSWIEREIYQLKKNIDLNRVRIADDNSLLEIYLNDLERVRNEVILDAVSHTNLENLEYQIDKLNGEIALRSEENRIYRKQIGYLSDLLKKEEAGEVVKIEQENGHVMLTGAEDQSAFKIFTSPIDGAITRLLKQPFEVALKTENILSIHQPNDVHIKGFFDQTDLRYLKEGDIVDVEFPDGTMSVGIVDRFYSATYILPEEFQKKFEPTTRTLAADIIPLGINDLEIWKKYYKLSVKITKRTF